MTTDTPLERLAEEIEHCDLIECKTARATIADLRSVLSELARLREALDWYRRTVAVGDRAALERDAGSRAASALEGEKT